MAAIQPLIISFDFPKEETAENIIYKSINFYANIIYSKREIIFNYIHDPP
jgi:hypothetical protein